MPKKACLPQTHLIRYAPKAEAQPGGGRAEEAQTPPLAIRILMFISYFFTNIVL